MFLIASKLATGALDEEDAKLELSLIRKKYQTPEKFDQLARANLQVDQVKIKMEDNIHELMKNQADIEVLSHPKL